MTYSKKLRMLLAGGGGYGRFYLEAFERPEIMEKTEFAGVVEPYLAPDVAELLKSKNIPVFQTLKEAYGALGQIDLTCCVTPLPYHLEHITTAVQNGNHVLCEKPATPVLAQLEPLIAMENEKNLCLAIGFQWSFAPAMLACKRDILAGVFGKPVYAKALVLWPRPESYFKRGSGWAGKRFAEDGTVINDNVASNVTAHYLHNLYFMLGKSMNEAAMPAKMKASVARANQIENYDSICLEAETADGVKLFYLSSLSVEHTQNPLIEYRFEKAAVRYNPETNRLTAYFDDGTEKDYGDVEADVHTKLEAVIDGIRNGNYRDTVFCLPSTCKPHVWTVDTIFYNEKIHPFSSERVARYHAGDAEKQGVYVKGLEEACKQAYEKREFVDFTVF